ncbi:mitochondrial 54S ribosomal protein YmL19 [Cichlidogyrus casuarinus]|uniref:Large ribosomal subunit protein bL19m n=1 Tax=Cichlidogyrus casuarinus TaxID=1844966 RepID=A0ABD2QDB4_9PLAT
MFPDKLTRSILRVVRSDEDSPTKTHSFTGICILKVHEGLWSRFTLRNVVDTMGIEYEYMMYSPKLQSIKVLLLEKRLDENLLYLRDAPLSESRIPFDMTPVPHAIGEPVPVNPKKVPILLRRWPVRWHLHGYRGIDEETMYKRLTTKQLEAIPKKMSVVDRYDLMKHYRKSPDIHDEEVAFTQVQDELDRIVDATADETDSKNLDSG